MDSALTPLAPDGGRRVAAQDEEAAMQVRNVCVIDDDDGYRELLAVVLEMHCGIADVQCFSHGADAVRELGALPAVQRPQLVLLDFHMPGMNGLAVIRALREAGLQLPVAMISNAASESDRADCLAAGAMAFLRKPTRIEELAGSLRPLLQAAAAANGTP